MKGVGLYLNSLAHVAPRKAAKIGFDLFCHPLRVPIHAKQRAFLESASQTAFVHGGIKLKTYQWGNGPKNILLLHGWQSHTYRWKKYIESLSKDEYTIHAFDAPGHGLSEGRFLSVPLYSEVIEDFIGRIGDVETIIAHSIGSFSAIYTYYRNKNLPIRNLVSLASPGEAQEFLEYYKKSLSLSEKSARLIAERFFEIFQKTPGDFSAPRFATALNIPGLIIHDEEDEDTSSVHSKKIHAAWKGSTLISTRGFGHNLRSDEVIRQVVHFIDRQISSHKAVILEGK